MEESCNPVEPVSFFHTWPSPISVFLIILEMYLDNKLCIGPYLNQVVLWVPGAGQLKPISTSAVTSM